MPEPTATLTCILIAAVAFGAWMVLYLWPRRERGITDGAKADGYLRGMVRRTGYAEACRRASEMASAGSGVWEEGE